MPEMRCNHQDLFDIKLPSEATVDESGFCMKSAAARPDETRRLAIPWQCAEELTAAEIGCRLSLAPAIENFFSDLGMPLCAPACDQAVLSTSGVTSARGLVPEGRTVLAGDGADVKSHRQSSRLIGKG